MRFCIFNFFFFNICFNWNNYFIKRLSNFNFFFFYNLKRQRANITYFIDQEKNVFHESNILNLDIAKSKKILQWEPIWGFEESMNKTIQWYRNINSGGNPYEECLKNIKSFETENKFNK